MPKSKDAFRTISEVAEWLETPAHVLRFWESKFTQVKPVKRAGGRRYYRPADMQLLGGIKKLLHDDGLTIKGAQKLLREHGVKHVAALSQPLEDDLLDDENIVQEAAYEPDAQPEPQVEEPATVLSFPSRAEPKVEEKPVAEPETVTSAAPIDDSIAADDEPVVEVPAEDVTAEPEISANESEGEDTSPDRAGDAPAFGSDALPAFLRRSPATSARETEESSNEEIDASTETPPAPSSEKVSINPTAHFEPVETAEDEGDEDAQDQATVEPEASSEDAPQPVFSRTESTEPKEERKEETPPVEAAERHTIDAAPKALAVDVPSPAKVAPSLDSYEAKAGVLAGLPGARRVSPELASELSAQLAELRALRDRMQSL